MTIKGGVINNTTALYLIEEMNNCGIDIDFQAHLKECTADYHDNCYQNDSPTIVLGFVLNPETGKYDPDPDAEFSAIMGEVYTQVVASKYKTNCRICSPCYPDQNNLDEPGDWETYSLPPDMYDPEHNIVPEIVLIKEVI